MDVLVSIDSCCIKLSCSSTKLSDGTVERVMLHLYLVHIHHTSLKQPPCHIIPYSRRLSGRKVSYRLVGNDEETFK